MKLRTLFLAALGAAVQLQAANYYIAPSGDDSADGCSATTAMATLGAAQKLLQPGDTLFILPGVYRPTEVARTEKPGPYAVVYDLALSGAPGRPVVITGVCDDSGRRPVFDLSGAPSGVRVTGFLLSGERLMLKNIEIVGIPVTRTDHTQSENIRISGGAWNTVENVACHDGMGIGVYVNKDSHHNLIVNCDGYNQYDPVSDVDRRTGMGSGGNNDGFGCHVRGAMNGNMFIGCRAWNNTDDGFDLINCYSPVTFAYSLALRNGYDAQGVSRADGNGFKAGGFGMKPRQVELHAGRAPRHTVMHNVAVANKANGVYANHHLGGIDFRRNTSVYNRNYNYSLVNRRGPGAADNVDVDGYGHVMQNNASISRTDRHAAWTSASSDISGNYMAAVPDMEVDFAGLTAPRRPDGMLSAATLNAIKTIAVEPGTGADFSGYEGAVADARKTTGAEAVPTGKQ